MLTPLAPEQRQYLLVTGNYWVFTLSDGALRMLVVLHFYGLGYSPLKVALLFLFYEFFGVVTNLLGGWLGSYLGLNRTMRIGLGLQVLALVMLLVPASWLSVPWVMAAQALSGVAKDLNKMSAKSTLKLLLPEDAQGRLYHWVALLTGSKNALKGVGFFLGGFLLMSIGFSAAVAAMAASLALVWLLSLGGLTQNLGRVDYKPRFRELLAKSQPINILSAARLCLFAARDVWFVVALPVFLSRTLGWNYGQTGGFLALWIIGYGLVQALAPRITGRTSGRLPDGRSATVWAGLLLLLPGLMVLGLMAGLDPTLLVMAGLLLFGAVFAINSSLHSYLIIRYARREGVSLDVGFYYMANALGRLLGTLLSGWLFQLAGQGVAGLAACLGAATVLLAVTALVSAGLPRHSPVSL